MKKRIMIIVLALASIGVLAFAATRDYPTEPAGFNVSTDAQMIMAPRLVKAKDWSATTLYAHGDMVRDTNRHNKVYWCVSGWTNAFLSTNNPTHLKDDQADGATNSWRRIPPVARKGFIVYNMGTSGVWLAIGYPAGISNGYYLASSSTWTITTDNMQDYVSAMCDDTGTNRVTTQEW